MTWVIALLLGAAVIVLIRLPATWFVVCVLVAMWATRWAVPIAGVGVRLENIVGAAAAIRVVTVLLRRPRPRLPTCILVAWGAIIIWMMIACLTAVFVSPEPFPSIRVIVWTLGGIATGMWLALNPSGWQWVLVAGMWIALAFMALGLVAWSLSTAGLGTLLVQPDLNYGGYAAYGASHEANLFAGLVCLWAILSAFNPGGVLPLGLRVAVIAGAPIVIVAAHTRAALVALALALALWLLSKLRWTAIFPVGLALALLGLAFPFVATLDRGLGKFTETFDLTSGTGVLRVSSSATALDEWTSEGPWSWFTGLGFNSYGQRHLEPTRPLESVQAYLGTLPIQLLYDGGVLAVVLIAIAVGATAYTLFRRLDQMSVLVVAVAGAYFTISLATSSIWLLQTWVLAGLAWSAVAQTEKAPAHAAALTEGVAVDRPANGHQTR